MSDPVDQLASLLTDQPLSPLRPNQVADYREELERLEQITSAPQWMSGDRGLARQSAMRVKRVLAEQAPKPIRDPIKRDHIARLAETVLNDVIRPSMLPYEEMRRNPAGAVDQYMRREGSKPIKRAIVTWRRAMRALEPDNDEPNFCNIERFRPRLAQPNGAASFMVDAQIPGHFAMTPTAKEHWPLGEPPTTALAQAKARDERAEGVKERRPRRPRKPMTPEVRAKYAENLRRAHAAIRAKRNGGIPTPAVAPQFQMVEPIPPSAVAEAPAEV